MRNPFGASEEVDVTKPNGERVPRYSSGWKLLLKHLQESESQKILDIGPTSSININYITQLGHSVFMADLVQEAAKPEWLVNEGGEERFDVERFLTENLEFAGRTFDVVLFWDTADYMPEVLLAPVLAKIHAAMRPGGLMLAFFHVKKEGHDTAFARYHLTGTENVEVQAAGRHKLLQTFNNRQIENLLNAFAGYRFFLAKDNLREVIVTR